MIEGQIALAARGYLPETWDALANSSFYGEGLLDAKRNFVKFMLFGTVSAIQSEATLYNPLVLEYAAKGLCITIIPAAADFYANKLQTVVSSGTSESRSYPDRIASLWRIHARLLVEMHEMRNQVAEYVPTLNSDSVMPFLPTNSGSDFGYLSIDPHYWHSGDNVSIYGNLNLPWSLTP